MEKKILYVLFAATTLMATSSLLSSCKDYSEDAVADLKTQQTTSNQELQTKINELKRGATSISVDGVKNNIFGMIKTAADVQTNMLFGFYGEAASDIDFPSTSKASYADTAIMLEVPAGVTLNKQKVSAGHLFYNELGTVYYTINPLDLNFADIDIKLMNSQNQTKGISLSNVAVSSEVLNMGWTRAASASTGFYQSTATVEDYATIEKIDINADDYVALIKNIKSEDNAGTVNSLATAVKNTLSAFQTNAYALGIMSEDTPSQLLVKSPLSIQAALVKPVSYSTTAQMPATAEWTHNKLVEVTNRVVKTIVEKLQEKMGENTADLEAALNELKGIQHIYFDFDSVTVLGNYTIPAEFDVNPYSGETVVTKWEEKKVKLTKEEFAELAAMMNIQADNINDAIDKINKACEEGLKIINRLTSADLTTSVNSGVNQLINDLWEKINKFYQEVEYRFELALFVEDGNCKVASRSVSNAPEVSSSFKAHMSNLNAELLVPAYKKHLLCTWASDGDVQTVNQSINKVYDGTQKSVTVSGIKSGVIYEISYSGLDYTGKQMTRKFYVRGK